MATPVAPIPEAAAVAPIETASAPAPAPATESAPAEDATSAPTSNSLATETPTPQPAPDATAALEATETELTVAGLGPLKSSHPLLRFHAKLPALIKDAGHAQIWGVTLDPATPTFATLLILQKYLRSVSDDVDAAAAALRKTLAWRREFGLDGAKPIWDEEFGDEFTGLGYLTHIQTSGREEAVTWNLYGAVSDLGETFGNLDK